MNVAALTNSNYYVPVSSNNQQIDEKIANESNNAQVKEIDKNSQEVQETSATYKENQENTSNNSSSNNQSEAPVYTGEEILSANKEDKKESPKQLAEEEKEQVEKLKERDREVKTHEQAHIAAGGAHVKGGATYEYQTGPDGKQYAVGGHVNIDTSAVEGDPQATITKAQTIIKAALAPAEPSGQDRAVAAKASKMMTEARKQLNEEKINPEKEEENSVENNNLLKIETSEDTAQSNGSNNGNENVQFINNPYKNSAITNQENSDNKENNMNNIKNTNNNINNQYNIQQTATQESIKSARENTPDKLLGALISLTA